MEDNNQLFISLSKINWLANMGQPEADAQIMGSIEQIIDKVEQDPDAFFEPPYTNPYEAMCATDHREAAQIESKTRDPRPESIAKAAYLTAWECFPDPELCGLVSDDAHTIAFLLLTDEPLRPFTRERMQWYEQGRMPWGYLGTYPNGQWLIL